jgi:hypothetical protein
MLLCTVASVHPVCLSNADPRPWNVARIHSGLSWITSMSISVHPFFIHSPPTLDSRDAANEKPVPIQLFSEIAGIVLVTSPNSCNGTVSLLRHIVTSPGLGKAGAGRYSVIPEQRAQSSMECICPVLAGNILPNVCGHLKSNHLTV